MMTGKRRVQTVVMTRVVMILSETLTRTQTKVARMTVMIVRMETARTLMILIMMETWMIIMMLSLMNNECCK